VSARKVPPFTAAVYRRFLRDARRVCAPSTAPVGVFPGGDLSWALATACDDIVHVATGRFTK
jgi:hypothetical protein